MEPTIFKPKYEVEYPLALVFIFLLGFIIGSPKNGVLNTGAFVTGSGCILLGLFIMSRYSRKIYFDNNHLVIQNWLLLNKYIDYSELTDISPAAIVFGRRIIPLAYMKNAEELYGLINSLIKTGAIAPNQVSGNWVIQSLLLDKAFRYSIIPMILLGFISIYLVQSVLHLEIDGWTIFLVTISIIFSSVYLILKRHHNAKKNN